MLLRDGRTPKGRVVELPQSINASAIPVGWGIGSNEGSPWHSGGHGFLFAPSEREKRPKELRLFNCGECQVPFTAHNPKAKFCSLRCRKAANRRANGRH